MTAIVICKTICNTLMTYRSSAYLVQPYAHPVDFI